MRRRAMLAESDADRLRHELSVANEKVLLYTDDQLTRDATSSNDREKARRLEEIEGLKHELNNLKQQNEDTNQKNAHLSEEVSALQAKVNNNKSNDADVLKYIAQLQSSAAEKNAVLLRAREEIGVLRARIDDLVATKLKVEDAIQTVMKENMTLKDQVRGRPFHRE